MFMYMICLAHNAEIQNSIFKIGNLILIFEFDFLIWKFDFDLAICTIHFEIFSQFVY